MSGATDCVGAVAAVKAVDQGPLRPVAADAAEDQRAAVAAKEIRLQGVLGVAETQFAADDSGLEQAPSVAAHQSPHIRWKGKEEDNQRRKINKQKRKGKHNGGGCLCLVRPAD